MLHMLRYLGRHTCEARVLAVDGFWGRKLRRVQQTESLADVPKFAIVAVLHPISSFPDGPSHL